MLPSESPSASSAPAGNPAADPLSATRAADQPRVRQLCPAGITPGTPWRNGVIPLAAYVIYTPTHALTTGSCSASALS